MELTVKLVHMLCQEVNGYSGTTKELWLTVQYGVSKYAVISNYGMTRVIDATGSTICEVLAYSECGQMKPVNPNPAWSIAQRAQEDVEHYNRMLARVHGRARDLLR